MKNLLSILSDRVLVIQFVVQIKLYSHETFIRDRHGGVVVVIALIVRLSIVIEFYLIMGTFVSRDGRAYLFTWRSIHIFISFVVILIRAEHDINVFKVILMILLLDIVVQRWWQGRLSLLWLNCFIWTDIHIALIILVYWTSRFIFFLLLDNLVIDVLE